MKKKPALPIKENPKKLIKVQKKLIKVQLDHRTVITISSIEKLKTWMSRFPGAKVITA